MINQQIQDRTQKHATIQCIKQIIDFSWVGRRKYFQIAWIDNDGEQHLTWQPLSNLNDIKQQCRIYFSNLTEQQKKKTYNPSLKFKKGVTSKKSSKKNPSQQQISQQEVENSSLGIGKTTQQINISSEEISKSLLKQQIPEQSVIIEQEKDPQLLKIAIKIKPQNYEGRNIKIIKAKVVQQKINFLVEWQAIQDEKVVSKLSLIDKETLRKYWPEKLLEYYESKVNWKPTGYE